MSFESLVSIQNNTALKLNLSPWNFELGLVSIQNNTALKPERLATIEMVSLVSIQNNTALKPRRTPRRFRNRAISLATFSSECLLIYDIH